MDDSRSPRKETRREILKKAAYVAPAVLTLTASPAFAQRGSNGRIEPIEKLPIEKPPIVKLPIEKPPIGSWLTSWIDRVRALLGG
jgi:hypothetical protein